MRGGYADRSSERAAGAAEQLAGADTEQRAVLRPDACLAADQSARRARRERVDEEPRFCGAPAVEPDRQVDARGVELGPYVVPAGRGPAHRVEEDDGATRVDPQVVERRRGQEPVP